MLKKALEFAEFRHRGQKRKYYDCPYILHPIRVAFTAREYFTEDSTAIIAAILHDVIEDTDTTLEEIATEFGEEVAKLVDELTSLSKKDLELSKQNRKARIFANNRYLANVSKPAKILKALDRIDNLCDMTHCPDQGFKVKYANESLELLLAICDGIPFSLYEKFSDTCYQYINKE